MTKVTPFLMFNDQLEAAIAFYHPPFLTLEIKSVARTGKDGPITSAGFVIGGQSFMGYNGGSSLPTSRRVLAFVDCEDRKRLTSTGTSSSALAQPHRSVAGSADQFGVTWQIVPRRFMELINDTNPKKVQGVMEAMMTMVKLDVAALEKAYDAA
ncbi:MAG: VOC family protein [Chloroflexi bacterium]|nr:VOC family protein [Chloroflexota bacterium]